jgi:hypothetical protein
LRCRFGGAPARTARRDFHAMIEAIDTADRTDPTLRKDPIDPIEPTDPIDPTERIEPFDQRLRMDPSDL